MNGWQPIETAPKDGLQRVLITDGSRVRESYYVKSQFSNGYWNIDGNGAFLAPTHWMPVPSPPERT